MSINFEERMLIAFDGPSASGKSSLAKKIAQYYNLPFLNTGKIYRFISFNLTKKYANKDLINSSNLEEICLDLIDELKKNDIIKSFEFLDSEISSEECGKIASKISKFFNVRKKLEELQREFAYKDERGCVLEGRDIGSVILPEANFKIFITADLDVRALRRFNQLSQKNKNQNFDLGQIKQMIFDRDQEDSSREYAPLNVQADAFFFDTSKSNFDSSVEDLIKYIEFKKNMLSLKNKRNIENDPNQTNENFCFSEKKNQ